MQKNKLRILIFDHQHFRSLYIERILNRLGYYCIAPVSRFEELVVIVERSNVPVSLVCYNVSDCKKHDGVELFFRNNSCRIKYLMPYNELNVLSENGEYQGVAGREAGCSLLPDFFTIRNKMKAIESDFQNK